MPPAVTVLDERYARRLAEALGGAATDGLLRGGQALHPQAVRRRS